METNIEWRRWEEEDISSYWIALRKREVTETRKRKHSGPSLKNSFWKKLWTVKRRTRK